MATTQHDAAGRTFAPPSPGRAALYVYRADKTQPVVWRVVANQAALGDLAPHTWLRADLPAGNYDLRCTGGNASAPSLLMELVSGETRYVDLGTEWFRVACTMKGVAAATAQPAILAGRRVRELR